MSTGKDMPEIDIQKQFGEVPDVFTTSAGHFEVLDQYHKNQSLLHEACGAFAAQPSTDNRIQIGSVGADLLHAFYASVDTIVTDKQDGQDPISMVANLMIADDDKRVLFFRDLTKSDEFALLREGDGSKTHTFEDILRELVEENGLDNLATIAKSIFHEGLQKDITKFLNVITDKHESSPAHRRRVMAMNLGRHTLDVAKIAAGTAIAIWALKRKREA